MSTAALVVFVAGFVLLYLQSHRANERRAIASRSVKANSARYVAGVVGLVRAGRVTGAQLLELRDRTYHDGGGLSQGITHVGASAVGANLIVTYQVQVNFRGSFHAAARALSCYDAQVSTRSAQPALASFHTIDCQNLLPAVSATALLRPT